VLFRYNVSLQPLCNRTQLDAVPTTTTRHSPATPCSCWVTWAKTRWRRFLRSQAAGTGDQSTSAKASLLMGNPDDLTQYPGGTTGAVDAAETGGAMETGGQVGTGRQWGIQANESICVFPSRSPESPGSMS
jgi:hypothetical protein